VKKNIRIAGVFLLMIIWFLPPGAAVNSYAYSDFGDDPVSAHITVIPDFSANLFCNPAPAESEVNGFNYFPVPVCIDPFSEPGAIHKAIERSFETEFAQYTLHSRDFLVQYRKSDIIFPFHYFW